MNKIFRKRNQRLTNAQQHQRIKTLHPQFSCKVFSHRKVSWVGTIQPTEISYTYDVRIIYESFKRPKIQIIRPKLNLPNGKIKLPHVYIKDELCLYYPKYGEWNSQKYIAETIIPWISLWLFYYEGWLMTGKWFGGGIEHGDGVKK